MSNLSNHNPNCPLCSQNHEPEQSQILFENNQLRIIAVLNEPDVPAFCRVIWNEHVAEMTDLNEQQRNELMNAVYCVERAFRAILKPTKINLASLGNVVPHVHWHIIARFEDDVFFPASIWANKKDAPNPPHKHFRQPENPKTWISAVQTYISNELKGLNK